MSQSFYTQVMQAVRKHAPATFDISDLPLTVLPQNNILDQSQQE